MSQEALVEQRTYASGEEGDTNKKKNDAPARRPAVDVRDHVVRDVLRPLPASLQGVLHVRAVAALRRQDELVVAQQIVGPVEQTRTFP